MQDLILDERCVEMINYGYVALRQLPKSETHVLGAQIRSCMLKIHRLIITAAKKFHKKYRDGTIEQKAITQAITSWVAHANHADTFHLRTHLFKQTFKRGSNNAVHTQRQNTQRHI